MAVAQSQKCLYKKTVKSVIANKEVLWPSYFKLQVVPAKKQSQYDTAPSVIQVEGDNLSGYIWYVLCMKPTKIHTSYAHNSYVGSSYVRRSFESINNSHCLKVTVSAAVMTAASQNTNQHCEPLHAVISLSSWFHTHLPQVKIFKYIHAEIFVRWTPGNVDTTCLVYMQFCSFWECHIFISSAVYSPVRSLQYTAQGETLNY